MHCHFFGDADVNLPFVLFSTFFTLSLRDLLLFFREFIGFKKGKRRLLVQAVFHLVLRFAELLCGVEDFLRRLARKETRFEAVRPLERFVQTLVEVVSGGQTALRSTNSEKRLVRRKLSIASKIWFEMEWSLPSS